MILQMHQRFRKICFLNFLSSIWIIFDNLVLMNLFVVTIFIKLNLLYSKYSLFVDILSWKIHIILLMLFNRQINNYYVLIHNNFWLKWSIGKKKIQELLVLHKVIKNNAKILLFLKIADSDDYTS